MAKPTYEELEKRLQALELLLEESKEKTWQNSEQKIKSILQAAPIGIGVVSNRIITEVNQKFCEITGYSREELLGQNAKMVYASDEAYEYVGKEKYRMIHKTGTGSVETTFRRKDGEIIDVLVSSTPIDPENLSAGVTFTALDITERIKAEKELRLSERKFRLLADHTHDWEYWIDQEGNYVYLSPSCERITGYGPEEFIADPEFLYKIVHPDHAEKVLHHYTNENHPGFPIHSMEFPIIAKNGQEIWLEHNCTPVHDDQGNYAGRRGNNRDITDRKKAEAELIHSEKKWHNILVNTPQIGISLDPEARITFANNHFLSLTGWKENEIMGQDWFDFFIPENIRGKIRKVFQTTMTQKDTTGFPNYENEILTKNGEVRNVAWANVLTKDPRGNIIDVTSLGLDLTEKKELEAKFNQAQKMESVGRLAGGVAHDFNNALSVIMGFTEMALNELDPEEPLHEDLNEILTAGRRAADITRQLLAFARKQTIAPVVLDFNTTIEDMLKMLRRLIGEDIDLAWMPGSNLWPVMMDPSQIDQILANLCVNARDAIQGVGKITIESKNVFLNEEYCRDHPGFVSGEFVQLSVSDSGCGMDKATLENIFEPFFTTKEVGKGTGLGLATVYGIIKQNNGFINVYSEPDKGTTIKIYLPKYGTKTDEIPEESAEKIPSGHGETILVVEDDPTIIELMKKILERLDYKVLCSRNPEKVLDMAKAHTNRIHLLITDVIMPKMNGRDLADQLQSIFPNLKCIFMSGHTANIITNEGVLDKGKNFIQKPFSRKELADMIRKVLDVKS